MSKSEMLPELPSADAGAHIPRSPDAQHSDKTLGGVCLGLIDGLSEIAALQATKPEPVADENGYTNDGDIKRIISDAEANQRWRIAEIARRVLFENRPDGAVDGAGAL